MASNKTYLKTIYPENWDCSDVEDPFVKIPVKEHDCGKKPSVRVSRNGRRDQISNVEVFNGEVTIFRGLPVYKGTPYILNVEITK